VEYAEGTAVAKRTKHRKEDQTGGGLAVTKEQTEKKKLNLTKQKYRFHIKKPLPPLSPQKGR